MTKALEEKALKAKVSVANDYLNDIWKRKGKVTEDDVYKVVTPIMLENGAVVKVIVAENYDWRGSIVPAEEELTFVSFNYYIWRERQCYRKNSQRVCVEASRS